MQLFCAVLNHENGIENTDLDTKNLASEDTSGFALALSC